MEVRIPQQGNTNRGEGIIEREGTTFIASFTDPEKVYHVTEHGCSCPAAKFGGRYCKHRRLFKALQSIDARFGRRIAERRVVELAHRIYRQVEGPESLRDSYDLMLDTFSERYATDEMKHQAVRRHGRCIALAERKAKLGKAVA